MVNLPLDGKGSVKEASRILIIGTSGSGKTWLANQLSTMTNIPFIPTDPFYWKDHWCHSTKAEIIEQVKPVLKRDSWIMDGNFIGLRPLVWARVELAIWLDFPFHIVLYQIAKRNIGWWLTGAKVWSGQTMTLRQMVKGVRHSARSHFKKRRDYPDYLKEFPHLSVVRLTSRQEVLQWLKSQNGFGVRN